jgi:hypothetical protein
MKPAHAMRGGGYELACILWERRHHSEFLRWFGCWNAQVGARTLSPVWPAPCAAAISNRHNDLSSDLVALHPVSLCAPADFFLNALDSCDLPLSRPFSAMKRGMFQLGRLVTGFRRVMGRSAPLVSTDIEPGANAHLQRLDATPHKFAAPTQVKVLHNAIGSAMGRLVSPERQQSG